MSGPSKAEKFVEFLLNEGAKYACDESSTNFTTCGSIPSFFDKQKFKRGQDFYHKNKLGMLLGMYFYFLVGLAVPWIRKILMLTNMSSTARTAYRRYLQTYYYIHFWYTEEFNEDSSLFGSLSAIRKLHNEASNKASKSNLPRITQRDMALTQVGFIGFLLVNPERFGIHRATDEDKEAILHVWRVIGFKLGMEDRFNVCGSSIQETREIVSAVLCQVVIPNINERQGDFLQMAEAYLHGLKVILPFTDLDVVLTYAVYSFTDQEHTHIAHIDRLRFLQKLKLMLLTHFMYLSKYSPISAICNCLINVNLWIQGHFVRPHFTPSRK